MPTSLPIVGEYPAIGSIRSGDGRITSEPSLRRNLQIGKVALGTRPDPQSHSPLPRLELQIVDDEARLLRAVHVEACLAAFHFNLVLRPHARLEVDVRLVFLGGFLPRPGKIKIRMGTVLSGVIPPDLIVGTAVGGPEIDVFVAS